MVFFIMREASPFFRQASYLLDTFLFCRKSVFMHLKDDYVNLFSIQNVTKIGEKLTK